MKLLILSHVIHGKVEKYFGYAPYIREMNLWIKYADQVVVVAPIVERNKLQIDANYEHSNLRVKRVGEINFQSASNILRSVKILPAIILKIFHEIKSADHIHLRCPGNIGLLGCLVQIFFPSKHKSAKYAGNWDPQSKQPFSYRLQKWILSNTFLTKNMTVLVYGDWPDQSKNVKSFFTATYSEIDKQEIFHKSLDGVIKFLFVGTLSSGKRPLYAVQIVHELIKRGHNVTLELYGEGVERVAIEEFIKKNTLQDKIILAGNINDLEIRKVYQESHFLILPSKSEGWPKVVAEAMFWKCLPISSPVSCVPYMLDYGNRGILINNSLEQDVTDIENCMHSKTDYQSKVMKAMKWSRHFTVDLFEAEIKQILIQ